MGRQMGAQPMPGGMFGGASPDKAALMAATPRPAGPTMTNMDMANPLSHPGTMGQMPPANGMGGIGSGVMQAQDMAVTGRPPMGMGGGMVTQDMANPWSRMQQPGIGGGLLGGGFGGAQGYGGGLLGQPMPWRQPVGMGGGFAGQGMGGQVGYGGWPRLGGGMF